MVGLVGLSCPLGTLTLVGPKSRGLRETSVSLRFVIVFCSWTYSPYKENLTYHHGRGRVRGCLGRPRLGSGWEEHFVRLMIPENSPFKRTLTTQTWSLNSVQVEIRKVDPLSKLNGKSCSGHLTLAPPPIPIYIIRYDQTISKSFSFYQNRLVCPTGDS